MTDEMKVLLEKLTTIPDYPALREVQKALWGRGETCGAALMVGAGFSLNAERTSNMAPQPPLWRAFSMRMAADLYPGVPEAVTIDPLRLAEEYRAQFGPPALEAMIREMVPDRLWSPGFLHRELLALPWTDVLTTNWDTLLERAAADDHRRSYEVVETVDAIARTRSPRIVKLHGSLPSHTPFIFAAEDYRKYPVEFAPFVNLAQQALLENEMVLLGFSGDDPNFLQWTGWVRDQLGGSARRIRLVGVLRLSTARRRLLESQNVTPIDLEPLVRDVDPADQHRVATEVFLASLRAARPAPVKDWAIEERLEEAPEPAKIADLWEKQRTSYPGWLLAPNRNRYSVRFETNRYLTQLQRQFPELRPDLKGRLLREIIWRCDVSLWSLPHWVVEILPEALVDADQGFDRAARLQAYLALACDARRRRDQIVFHAMLEAAGADAQTSDERAAIAYERCIEARDRFDYAEVVSQITLVEGMDPVWTLRRASLHAWLQDGRKAARTAFSALQEIRRRRARDRQSLWLLSREAWAEFVVSHGWYELPELNGKREAWPSRYRERHCDPWDEISHFDYRLREDQRRRTRFAGDDGLAFEPGIRIRREGEGGWISSAILRPFDEMSRALDKAGFSRLPSVNVVEDRLQLAAELLDEDRCDAWLVLLSVGDWSKGLIEERFNRIAVARMERNLVIEQIAALRTAIDFGFARLARSRDPDHDEPLSWVEQIRRLLELLSRLSIRLDSDGATELFVWGAAMTRDPAFNHWLLFRPMSHLLERTFETIQPTERLPLATHILAIPLPGETEIDGIERDWPDLSDRLADGIPAIKRGEVGWADRIENAISLLGSDKYLARSRAMVLLYGLHKRGLLTEEEKAATAKCIWASVSQDQPMPDCNGLMPHILFGLPEPATGATASVFRTVLLPRLLDGQPSQSDFTALGSATLAKAPFHLTGEEAAALAKTATDWSPAPARSRHRLTVDNERAEAQARAHALTYAIVPALSDAVIDEPFTEKIFALATKSPDFVEVLPALVERAPWIRERAYRLIRRTMVNREVGPAYAGWRAVHGWMDRVKRDRLPLFEALVSDIVAAVEARREPSLLPALKHVETLVRRGAVSTELRTNICDTLDLLSVETAYNDQDRGGLRLDTMSLIRASCVRLAVALKESGEQSERIDAWLETMREDPLPEVRHALSQALLRNQPS